MKPKIHLLYPALEQLLWNLLSKFIKPKYINDDINGMKQLKSANELLSLEFSGTKIFKSLNKIDIGTKAKCCISASFLNEDSVLREKKFREDCLNCFQGSANHF